MEEPTINEFDGECRHDDWITTCNAREMFPGAGTPLTITVAGEGINYSLQRLQIHYGVREKYSPEKGIILWKYGSMFLNMTNTLAPMCSGMIGASMAKENGEMSILGRINNKCTVDDLLRSANGKRNILVRLFNGCRYVWTNVFAFRRIKIMQKRIEKADALLKAQSFVDADAQDQFDIINSFFADYLEQWADGVVCGATSAAFMLAVMKLLCKTKEELWTPNAVAELATVIASPDDEGVAESCDALNALEKIKEAILQEKSYAEEFSKMTMTEAMEFLNTEGTIPGNLYKQLLLRHGHRCIKESELRCLEWSSDQKSLVSMIQASVKAALSSGFRHRPKPDPRKEAEKIISGKSHLNVMTTFLLKLAIMLTRRGVRRRELGKSLEIKLHTIVKQGYRRLAQTLVEEGKLIDKDLIYFLSKEELKRLSRRECPQKISSKLRMRAIQRRGLLPLQEELVFHDLYKGNPFPVGAASTPSINVKLQLQGTPVSTGIVRGKARVVRTLEEAAELNPGEILVCPVTDVGWTPLFAIASGICTEIGGMLSHGAVVAREYGLPCVVNVPGVCSQLPTGTPVELDGHKGTISCLDERK